MATTRKIAEGIFLIDAYMWFPNMASVYLVVGKRIALIETGITTSASYILEGIKDLGFQKEDVSHIIVTHVHLDHAGSAGILLKEIPGATLVAHELGIPHLVDPTRLMEGARKALGDMISDRYRLDLVVPVEGKRVEAVKGGEVIDLGGRNLEIIATPGHAPHHISPYETEHSALFCGDLLGSYDSEYDSLFPFSPAPDFNPDVTIDTISKLKLMGIKRLLFSHFGESQEAEKVFNLAIQKYTEAGQVALEAWRNGGTLEYVAQQLLALVKDGTPYKPHWLQVESATLCAMGYVNYYKGKLKEE